MSTDLICLLAFDHRGSFQTGLLGVTGEPTAHDRDRIRVAKRIIFEGFQAALGAGMPPEGAGILVDEQFGAEVAHSARALGVMLAMPVEKSGQDEFEFEYGEQFGAHITAFEPTFAKVLVRYNPHGDAERNRRQAERLARLGEWLRGGGCGFLFELLVPPETAQLESVGSDRGRYDAELRPWLMAEAIEELQRAGVEPDVWKIEGLDSPDDCLRVAAVARGDGRDQVRCIVLGRGGDEAKVERWVRAGANVPGFAGFAVGRTIWWDPLEAWLAGAAPEDAARQIASNYRRLFDVYAAAAEPA
jgi:myo-inositol catabolism protein IolC